MYTSLQSVPGSVFRDCAFGFSHKCVCVCKGIIYIYIYVVISIYQYLHVYIYIHACVGTLLTNFHPKASLGFSWGT